MINFLRLSGFFSLLFFSTFAANVASAQTACPVGTQAGHVMCGPDSNTGAASQTPSRPVSWVKYDGHGAVALSDHLSRIFTNFNNDGSTAQQIADISMADCRQAGASDCRIVHQWVNTCSAAGSVIQNGEKQILFITGRSERAAERALRRRCAADGADESTCRVAMVNCANKWGGYVAH